uniref:Uncharacterized protein n=1 Tax=Tanacetum cinerariifolium TaxID=118510 RepID=A0A6L2MTZ4_TANCI|nr:hypothetical protein [Tanacetum cinerariifolium]
MRGGGEAVYEEKKEDTGYRPHYPVYGATMEKAVVMIERKRDGTWTKEATHRTAVETLGFILGHHCRTVATVQRLSNEFLFYWTSALILAKGHTLSPCWFHVGFQRRNRIYKEEQRQIRAAAQKAKSGDVDGEGVPHH